MTWTLRYPFQYRAQHWRCLRASSVALQTMPSLRLYLCALTSNVSAHNLPGNMIGQHSDQLVFIFRLQQIFDGAFRQRRKSFVGRQIL